MAAGPTHRFTTSLAVTGDIHIATWYSTRTVISTAPTPRAVSLVAAVVRLPAVSSGRSAFRKAVASSQLLCSHIVGAEHFFMSSQAGSESTGLVLTVALDLGVAHLLCVFAVVTAIVLVL